MDRFDKEREEENILLDRKTNKQTVRQSKNSIGQKCKFTIQ